MLIKKQAILCVPAVCPLKEKTRDKQDGGLTPTHPFAFGRREGQAGTSRDKQGQAEPFNQLFGPFNSLAKQEVVCQQK